MGAKKRYPIIPVDSDLFPLLQGAKLEAGLNHNPETALKIAQNFYEYLQANYHFFGVVADGCISGSPRPCRVS